MIDDSLSRRIIVYAGVTGALGVLLGAFSAHGLERVLSELVKQAPIETGQTAPIETGQNDLGEPGDTDQIEAGQTEELKERLSQFDVGVRYHLIHSVALLALSAVPFGSPNSRRWVCRLFLLGIILFSGSLYALVLSNVTQLGMVAPLGGLCWIVGWLMLLQVARPSSK